jgi:hypothetical protein
MSEEHVTMFTNAMNEWDIATEHQNINSYNNAVSFMLLAIKKAPEPFPKMHSFLAMIFYEAAICQAQQSDRHAEKKSKQLVDSAIAQANTALQLSPREFRAQLVKTFVASDNILYLTGGASNLIPRHGISGKGFVEFLGRAASTSVAAGRVGVSQAKFKGEVKSILEIYNQEFSEYYIDATDFCYYTDQLMLIADFDNNNKLGGARDIYQSIMNVELGDLKYDDLDDETKKEVEQEVLRLRALAEGRMMMM